MQTDDAFLLRPAIAADTDGVADCVNRAYEHYQERMGKAPGPMLQNYAEVIDYHAVYVCAVGADTTSQIAGEIVGVLVLMESADFVLVDNVAVYPRFQGLGVGKKMLAHAEDLARQWGYNELQLYTHIKMTENVAIYQRLGWSNIGERTVDGYQRIYMKKAVT